jgi:hypothetical protein
MTKSIALLAGILLSFAMLSPSPSVAQSDSSARMKSLEDNVKMIPAPELQKKLRAARMSTPKTGFTCTANACVCDGVDDCLDLIHTGICAPDSDKFSCAGGPRHVTCICSRH